MAGEEQPIGLCEVFGTEAHTILCEDEGSSHALILASTLAGNNRGLGLLIEPARMCPRATCPLCPA